MQCILGVGDCFTLPVQVLQYTHSQLLKGTTQRPQLYCCITCCCLCYQDHQDDILLRIWLDLSRFWSADCTVACACVSCCRCAASCSSMVAPTACMMTWPMLGGALLLFTHSNTDAGRTAMISIYYCIDMYNARKLDKLSNLPSISSLQSIVSYSWYALHAQQQQTTCRRPHAAEPPDIRSHLCLCKLCPALRYSVSSLIQFCSCVQHAFPLPCRCVIVVVCKP